MKDRKIMFVMVSRTCRAEAELLRNGRDLTIKWEQPWPQLVHCASIYCHVCGCIFQEDGIVARRNPIGVDNRSLGAKN